MKTFRTFRALKSPVTVRKQAIKTITLAPMEVKILRFLLERQGQVSTREQLIEAVWPDPHTVESRTVDVHIGRLRRAFAGLRNLRIRTAYGAGYALETTIDLRMS
ncbi:helix-turn-helix domain-containing protein [Rhizobium beringeri]|uniref:helix-turn-helix domain-containing protein n=1 Tax=Rhizobium beringeri TaxID=3019934 RepID=UPI003B5A8A6E